MKCPVLCPERGCRVTTAYKYHGCRCDVCRISHTALGRMRRLRLGPPPSLAPRNVALRSAKNRAKRDFLPFDLTLKDVPSVPTHCPILGLELQVKRGSKGGAQNSPSLDRIDPNLGYVTGNVQWLSQRANAMKSNATPEELLRFAAWVYKEYHS